MNYSVSSVLFYLSSSKWHVNVSKSREQFMVSSILPKNEQKNMIIKWICQYLKNKARMLESYFCLFVKLFSLLFKIFFVCLFVKLFSSFLPPSRQTNDKFVYFFFKFSLFVCLLSCFPYFLKFSLFVCLFVC